MAKPTHHVIMSSSSSVIVIHGELRNNPLSGAGPSARCAEVDLLRSNVYFLLKKKALATQYDGRYQEQIICKYVAATIFILS